MIIVCIILMIQSYWDMRYKEVPSVVTLCGGVLGFIYCLETERNWNEILMAELIGAVFLILGKITREAIGYGDGLILCMMGWFYSVEKLWGICMIALFLAAVVSLFLLLFLHKKGSFQLPFIPFILLGNLLSIVLV